MAATQAGIGAGTLFKRGNGASPQVFTTVAEAVEIPGFGAENPLEEATHMLSAAHEYLSGLPDGSQFTVTCNFIPTNATQSPSVGLIVDQANKTLRDFQIIWPTAVGGGATAHFSALVLKFSIDTSVSSAVKIAFTFKISGAIWWS